MKLLKGDGQTSNPKGTLKLVRALKKGDLRYISGRINYKHMANLIAELTKGK